MPLFLFMADIGGGELLLLTLLPLVVLLVVLWRLLRPSKPAVIVQQNTSSISVADELRKLQALRDAGTITAAEFEQQKAKLLA